MVVAVSFRRPARLATIVVVAIVVVTSAVSAAFDVVASSIVATRELASRAMGATIVGGAANLAAESFRRLAEWELLVTFDRLAVERSVALFLLVESLKKGRNRLEGRVLQRFAAEDVYFAIALVV